MYRNPQQGYLMPLAAFILVVMGLMAATLSRTTGQTGISVAQEAVTLQAFYAAETGAQLGMNNLFYDTVMKLNRGQVNSRCATMNIVNNFNATTSPGLGDCSVTVTCDFSTSGPTSFYTITSLSNCGSGEVTSTRTVEVSAFME